MDITSENPQLPSLLQCFAPRATRRMILLMLVASPTVSFFVTFILSAGLLDPKAFFNNFFPFFMGYIWVILGSGLLWGVVLSFIGVYFRSYLSPRLFLVKNAGLRFIAIASCGFVLAFLGLMILYHACHWFFNLSMWTREWNLSVACMAGLFGMVFAFLFFADYRNKVLLQQAEMREQELGRHRLEGELMNLNLRIRPHFFFNALNTLASLIDKDTAAAQNFLADLADLFRKSFTHGQDQPICRWHEEKEILEAYLMVEQMRFPDRLTWRLQVDAPDEAPFPAFLLQPLVENAVHHGISRSQSPGSLEIMGAYKLGNWNICISNSLSAPAEVTIERGHALWTIQERLRLMKGTLSLESQEHQFQAKLKWHGQDHQNQKA